MFLMWIIRVAICARSYNEIRFTSDHIHTGSVEIIFSRELEDGGE
jgi:hypothetical protein